MMLRATGVLFGSEMITTLALFARNILVARLISVEDFGIAATFAILWTVIETVTNFSVHKLLVQSPEGDVPRFQDTLHLLQVVRGVVSAGVMVLLSYPYAAIVQTPDLVWAYQVLALVPLIRGFVHLDVYRVQREMNFRPLAVMIGASPLISLVAVVAIYFVYPDFRVMLGAIVVQHLAAVLLSHGFAIRPFRLAWEMTYFRQSFGFGGPLLINGLLLMAVMQGERMIVANQTDLVTLGWFSAAFLLATTPARVLPNTINGAFLPVLSRAYEATGPEAEAAFQQRALLVVEVSLGAALWLAVGVAIAGPMVLTTFFGAEYAPGMELLVILGLAQAVRTARTACSTLAMAAGRTWDIVAGEVVRGLGVPVGLWVMLQGYGVAALIWTGLIFEVGALLLGLALNARYLGLSMPRLRGPLVAFGVVMCLVAWDLRVAPPVGGLQDLLHPAQLGLALAAVLALAAMPRLRAGILDRVRART